MPIVLILVLIAIAVLIWGAFGLIGLVVHLFVAGIVGWLADAIVPGDIPYGWLGAIAAGLLGSWLGRLLLGDVGPVIASVPIISALIGAIILAFVVDLIWHGAARRTTL